MFFDYHETDDESASQFGLTLDEVAEIIYEHNDYFGTNYQMISEFNNGEPHRKIVASSCSLNLN